MYVNFICGVVLLKKVNKTSEHGQLLYLSYLIYVL